MNGVPFDFRQIDKGRLPGAWADATAAGALHDQRGAVSGVRQISGREIERRLLADQPAAMVAISVRKQHAQRTVRMQRIAIENIATAMAKPEALDDEMADIGTA